MVISLEQRKKSPRRSLNTKKSNLIAFIGCSAKKLNKRCRASFLYQGTLFKESLKYCQNKYKEIYILSAKYGLIELDKIIEPYDLKLSDLNKSERKNWAERVKQRMKELKICPGKVDIFGGKLYWEFLEYNETPIQNHLQENKKRIGYQLEWIKKQNNKNKSKMKKFF